LRFRGLTLPVVWLVAAAVVLGVFSVAIWLLVLRGEPKGPESPVNETATNDSVAPVQPNQPSAGQEEIPPGVITARRLLDGVVVPEAAAKADRYAVIIDNMDAARPQAGLNQASVVIEAPAEGGITRFLAVFSADATVERVGPVRSARPYFIDWAEEYDAVLAHVGGSPEALERLDGTTLRDANDFLAGAYFWRDETRSAPHSTYTSSSQLARIVVRRYADRAVRPLSGWKFKEDLAKNFRPDDSKDIAINFSKPEYSARWTYIMETNSYARLQGGQRHKDENGAIIFAKNVIVQFAKTVVLDEVGRRRIVTVGSGDALVALDGRTVPAKWEKRSLTGRTRFYGANGDELSFNAGTTWIEVVPTGRSVEY